MMVGWSAHMVYLPASLCGRISSGTVFATVPITVSRAGSVVTLKGSWVTGARRGCHRGGGGAVLPGTTPARRQVAADQRRAIGGWLVLSASVKPRLAGRQPANRGGGARVMHRLRSRRRRDGKRGSAFVTGPQSRQGSLMCAQRYGFAMCCSH